MAKAGPEHLRHKLTVFFLQSLLQRQQGKQLAGRSDFPPKGLGGAP